MSATIDTTASPNALLDQWLGALDGVERRLRAGAMVADVGAGDGLTTLSMARAFPRSAFTGYDADAAAVKAARRHALEVISGSAGGRNVRFDVAEATEIPRYAFDLITVVDGLGDGDDALAAARHLRRAIAEDGTLMVVAGSGSGDADVLAAAGFTRVRVAVRTGGGAVLEARP